MTITELYNQLADINFQDPQTGSLFFPAYMYVYEPAKEYEVEQEILNIKNRLHRPNNYLDVLILDIYEEFINFLKTDMINKNSTRFDFYFSKESEYPKQVDDALYREASNPKFMNYLNEKIKEHHEQSKPYEVAYVLVKGFGNGFPHIRASKFMNSFEKHIKNYKLIIFYPGEKKTNSSLFGLLKEENLYRAIKLINE